LINARVENRQAISWLIERQYPVRFSKPEMQMSLANSFNHTVKALSITITREEVREIEAVTEPCEIGSKSCMPLTGRRKEARLQGLGLDVGPGKVC